MAAAAGIVALVTLIAWLVWALQMHRQNTPSSPEEVNVGMHSFTALGAASHPKEERRV